MTPESQPTPKPPLNLSLILAAAILGLCLIIAARILAKPTGLSGPSADTIASQAVAQIKDQLSSRSYTVFGTSPVTVRDVVVDHSQMSPDHNQVDVAYHIVWSPGSRTTGTGLTLIKDQYGRFDSGLVVLGSEQTGLPHMDITVQ